MVGIVFRPAGLHTLFGLPMYEFSDERTNLRDVLGRQLDEWSDKIEEAISHTERIALLEQFLNLQLLRKKTEPDRTDYAANLIVDKRGVINISDLMDELFVCRRQFERKFLQKVGVSPKYYARIRRVGVLCHELAQKRWQIADWQELIFQSGYYDQSIVSTNRNSKKALSNQKTDPTTARDLAKANLTNPLTSQYTISKITENQGITKEKPLKSNSVATIETISPESLADAHSDVSLAENTRSTLLNITKLTGQGWQFLKLSWPVPTVAYTPPPPPLAIPKKEDVSAFFRKGLSARILAGPDLSFISSNQMMKNPTLLLSVMLEYRFSKRLSLQAGVAKSSKLYTATGEQYQWPDAWYSQKIRPTSTWANCKVLDIPLNLRYDLSQRAKSRWFVSSGISSYLMLNEKYDYTYPPHSYPKLKNWEGSTGNYWFGVMNLSMGFERQIGRNLSIQAEPYFKLPLAEVGMGKIKLNTSGIFISARYKLGHL